MMARRQGDEGGVDQPHRQIANRRRVDGLPTGKKAGALNQIEALPQLFDEGGDVFNAVLVIPVHRNDAPITAPQRPPDPHTQLRTLLAGVPLDQQGVDAQRA